MNLIEGIQSEQKRCRELKVLYDSIPTGMFGSVMIQNTLDQSYRAVASGDCVEMLKAYQELKKCE